MKKMIFFSDEFTEERFQLISYIESELGRTQTAKQKRSISRIVSENSFSGINKAKDLNLLELNGEIDFILFLIYLRLKMHS